MTAGAGATRHIVLLCNQSQQGPNKLHQAFLDEALARASVQADIDRGIYDKQATYESLLQREDIVHFPITEAVYKKLLKTGVVYVAFHSDLRNRREAQPFAVAASRSGLVKLVRATDDPSATDTSLFQNSHQANAFLIDGYPVPAHFQLLRFMGPLLSAKF